MANDGLAKKWHEGALGKILLGIIVYVVAAILVKNLPSFKSAERFNPAEGCGASTFVGYYQYEKALTDYLKTFKREKQFSKDDLYNTTGEPRHVGDVLIDSLPELTKLAEAIKANKPYLSNNKLIFLYGPPGSGKSAVVSRLRKLSKIAFFDVGELFQYDETTKTAHRDTTLEKELVYNGAVISRMPQLKDHVLSRDTRLEEFFSRYNQSPAPDAVTNIIIDNLDEIHPTSATRLIDSAREFLKRNAGKNIILSGRGEPFRAFFEKEGRTHDFGAIRITPLYVGEDPLLSWFAAQYLWWKKEMKGTPPTPEEVKKRVADVTALLESKPILRNFMVTLAPADFVYEHIDYKEEKNLVELLYDRLLRRNRRKHYRPTSEHSELYKAALTQVARIVEIRKDGSFVLSVQKPVYIKYGQGCVPVKAAETLNLSGLVDLHPLHKDHLEYTFFPLPLHDELAAAK